MIVVGIDPTLSAYLAGLFDGDGYIGIKRRRPSSSNKMKSFRYSACINIGMTDREPVQLVADFCGDSHRVRRRVRKDGNKPIFEFECEAGKVEILVRSMLPYLIAKKRQGLIIIELLNLQKDERKHRTKLSGVHKRVGGPRSGLTYRTFSHSDEYLAQLDSLYQAALRCDPPRSGNGRRFRK